ncbi:uncharacterized protein LOC128327141 [Hemicordylus capensis]|uniref:uncharacterized protein LOC128327141 n=1 Tax=Hemicordylus capensis TaxID=884348 RepID=UPI0023049EBF|nr:uncharacterized protein LOC128327141 [Hemicordylus capensis]
MTRYRGGQASGIRRSLGAQHYGSMGIENSKARLCYRPCGNSSRFSFLNTCPQGEVQETVDGPKYPTLIRHPCDRTGSVDGIMCRYLFSSLFGLLARDSGFEKIESVCAKTHISNGVFKDNKGSRTPGQLLVLDRPFRGVLTCTDSSCLSLIPEVCLQSETIPVQGSTLRVVLSSSRIHQTHGGSDSLHALAGDPCLPVSGRLAREIPVLPSSLQGHSSGHPDTRGSRVCHQPYQEPPKPILCTPASGSCFRHEIGHSFSPNGLTTEDCLTHQAMAVQEMGFPHVSGSNHGLSDHLPRMHTLGQVAFETTSIVLASLSGSHYGKEADKTSLTTEGQEFSLVAVAGDRKVNTFGNSPEDRGDDRRQPLWLGGPLPGTSCAGVVGSEGFGEQYQLARVEGNSINSSAVP